MDESLADLGLHRLDAHKRAVGLRAAARRAATVAGVRAARLGMIHHPYGVILRPSSRNWSSVMARMAANSTQLIAEA